jgi:hypothetical protein
MQMTLEDKLDILIGLFREHAAYQRQILNRLVEDHSRPTPIDLVHQQHLSDLRDLTLGLTSSNGEFPYPSASSVPASPSFDPNRDLEKVYEKEIYGYLVSFERQMKGKTFEEITKEKSICKYFDHTFHTCVVNFFDFNSHFQNQNDARTKEVIDSEVVKRTEIVNAYAKVLNLFGVTGVDISKLHSRLRAKMRQSIRKTSKDLFVSLDM